MEKMVEVGPVNKFFPVILSAAYRGPGQNGYIVYRERGCGLELIVNLGAPRTEKNHCTTGPSCHRIEHGTHSPGA